MNKAEQIKQALIIGGKYRFENQPDTPDLMYIGKQHYGPWHKFTKYEEGRFGKVWAEVLDKELYMLEQIDTEPTASDLKCEWPSCGIEAITGAELI